jgi:hypothetical protein
MTFSREYIEEHDLLRRFSNGDLPAEEYEAFQAFLETSPEWREELEVFQLLMKGFGESKEAFVKQLVQDQASAETGNGSSLTSLHTGSALVGVAAALLLTAGLYFTFLKDQEDHKGYSYQPQIHRLATTLNSNLESPVNASRLTVFSKELDTALFIYAVADTTVNYRVSLEDAERQQVFSQTMEPKEGMLVLTLHRSLVTTGNYRLIIEKASTGSSFIVHAQFPLEFQVKAEN